MSFAGTVKRAFRSWLEGKEFGLIIYLFHRDTSILNLLNQ